MDAGETRAGTVAIVGLPNSGKSSLLNRLLETKLSIVTPSAQTTRERVVGIDSRDGAQLVFVDTPGIVDPAYLLHEAMLGTVSETIADADATVLLIDGTRPPPEIPAPIADRLTSLGPRLIVAINKTDATTVERLEGLKVWSKAFGTTPMEVSARTGTGVEQLRKRLAAMMPVSPFFYPEDEISSQSVRFFVAELIRETIFELYQEEVPYSSAVKIDDFVEDRRPVYIRATVFVERPSQKGILIGHRGAGIRELGTHARPKIEAFLQLPVYLDLWIKVLPKWRKNATELQRLGFSLPKQNV